MERNIMEELDEKLSLVTLDRAEIIEENYFQDFLEEICCRKLMRLECFEHFLDNTLMYNLHERMKSDDADTIYSTVYFIAELAKYHISRDYLSNAYLVCLLVDRMKRERNYHTRLETCRALCNMCFQHPDSQRLVAGQEPVETLFNLLHISCSPPKEETNERFKEVIFSLIMNLMAENDLILGEIADSYIPDLIKALDFDLTQTQAPIAHNIFMALISIAEVKPSEIVFSSKTCSSLVEMFRKVPVTEFPVSGLEFFEDSELPEVTKFLLAEAGIFDAFTMVLENKPVDLTEDENNKYDSFGRIMANILAGDDAMTFIFDKNQIQVINYLNTWLQSPDKDIVHIGALCLGNIARTDANSTAVVEGGAHKWLINAIKLNNRDVKILYAAVSTLRNLAIPPENRPALANDGLVDAIGMLMDLEMRTSAPIIYKAIGSLRQVIDGQERFALRLGHDLTFLRKLINWASSSVLPWVSSECSRLLCSIVNTSKDREVILNMLELGGYPQMTKLMTALHAVMQSEALDVMILTVNAAREEAMRPDLDEMPEVEKKRSERLSNFHNVLIECQIADKLKHLIARHGVKMERCVLEQCLTFVEKVLRIEQILVKLYYDGFRGVVYYVMRNREDCEQIRARVDQVERSIKFYFNAYNL